MSLAPGTNLGPYRILALLGRGGMGEVYRAEDPKLGRQVAVKVLPEAFAEDPDRLKRFEREAKALAALAHPNILAIHEFGTSGGTPYLVMELLEGRTLRQLMREGPMAPGRAAELAEQVAAGLAAAHERGIVHRDLKPENLFVTADRVVKILDFGLAKVAFPERSEATTETGTAVGTVSYMSPEQACGTVVNPRSDQFSLGVVLYEMLGGRRPFEGASAAETLAAIVRDEPRPLEALNPKVTEPLGAIVRRCLAKDPAQRYASTRDLARALRGSGEAAPGRFRGRARRVGLVLAGVVALASGAGVLWQRANRLHAHRKAGPTVLVILPTRVLGSPEAAFLEDAIPDTLSTLLAGSPGLDLKTPPTSRQVAEAGWDLAKVARAYGVGQLVTSTVTTQGEALFMNVQVVDATGRSVAWAGQFRGTRATYHVLLRQAADTLAKQLRIGKTGSDATLEPTEVDLALQEGKHHWIRYGREKRLEHFMRGVAACSRALALDPGNTSALSRLALLWRTRYIHTQEPAAIREAGDWARKALDLDPTCALAWYALAWVHADQHQLEEAVSCSIKAAYYAPQEAEFHIGLGSTLDDPGSNGLFLRAMDEATRLAPLDSSTGPLKASMLLRLRRPQEALRETDRCLALGMDDPFLHLVRAHALVELGRAPEAERILKEWHGSVIKATPWVRDYWDLVHFLCQAERLPLDRTRALARAMVRRYQVAPPDQYSLIFAMGALVPRLIRLDLRKEALDLLEKETEVCGGPSLDWLYEDPDLRRLQGDPRFTRVCLKARAKALRLLARFDQAKSQGEIPAYLGPSVEAFRALLEGPVPGGG